MTAGSSSACSGFFGRGAAGLALGGRAILRLKVPQHKQHNKALKKLFQRILFSIFGEEDFSKVCIEICYVQIVVGYYFAKM